MQEVFEFAKKNKTAILFIQNATEDYIAARVSFLNGLIQQGYISSQQAIEKMLKSFILLLSPNERIRDKKKYPTHELQPLLRSLEQLTGEDFTRYDRFCFILSKTYYCLRYPEEKWLPDFSINQLSTGAIHELDEMFCNLLVKLPLPDKNKCRLSVVAYFTIPGRMEMKNHFITNNNAYLKRINLFSKSFEWWQMTKEERDQLPIAYITNIQGVDCLPF